MRLIVFRLHSARVYVVLAQLLLVVLVTLAGCRSTAPTPTPTPTPTPIPTPTAAPTPTVAPIQPTARTEDILAQARQRMLAVGSFHFQVTQTGGGTPIIPTVEVVGMEGDVVLPDRFQAALSATVMGAPMNARVVAVGGKLYATNPITGQWQSPTDSGFLLGNFNPFQSIDDLLAKTPGLAVVGSEAIGGVATIRLSGTVDAATLVPLLGTFSLGQRVQVDLWVGQQDPLLYQVKIIGKVTATEKAGIVRVVKLSAFGQPVAITPPI